MPTRFQFYSKSVDAAPGLGSGETLSGNPARFDELELVPNWRRKLSNFASSPFVWRGLVWNTVEHAFHAAKFEPYDIELFHNFSASSGSELGLSDGETAQKHRKARILTKEQRKEWDKISASVMQTLWRHKFFHDDAARDVLLKTRDAELWHFMPRKGAVRWKGLEELRSELKDAVASGKLK